MRSLTPIFFSLLTAVYGSIGPNANLHIMNKNVSPDGFTRSAVLAGSNAASGTFPAPLITGSKGSRFNLNVVDSLTDDTMLKATSIDSLIAPTQYCDGLRGPFVVYDPHDPHKSMYDVDDDNTVITLADWYHTPAHLLPLITKPDSTLINGKGRYVNGPATPLSVITVTKGLRYRFRLVSLSCDPNYVFSIDGHNMTVIEADGVNVQPVTVNSLQIFAGQRYSFVLSANQPIGNYWIRAQPNNLNTTFIGQNSAILRYANALIADPNTTQSPYSNPLLESNLHPLVNPAAPGLPVAGGADVPLNLALALNTTSGRFSINGFSFDPPSVPVLLQILNGASPSSLLPSGSVIALPPNKVVELSIPGGAPGSPHPFHLHGVQRDVVSTGVAGDNVTIRFTTDNAGPWILHCHIDFHLDRGLAIVFAEDSPKIANSSQPASWDQLCPIYDSANPDSNLLDPSN
ncbi:hypothetical protein H0H92_015691 [Tricholoma furcatifolium]|nr:hypothetical protein H0H92_015691 [Tricholoma furcatifolium]